MSIGSCLVAKSPNQRVNGTALFRCRSTKRPVTPALCKNMNKEEYLKLAKSLEGELLSSVEYFEIKYDGYEMPFNLATEFDSLDYGINLFMQSGKVFGFIWGSEFTQYGVSILNSSLQSEVTDCQKVEVSNSANWSGFLGHRIVSSEVVWHWVKEAGLFKPKTYFPQSIVLKFSNDSSIVLSALEISNKSHWGMADNIIVFFNTETAEKYGALNA